MRARPREAGEGTPRQGVRKGRRTCLRHVARKQVGHADGLPALVFDLLGRRLEVGDDVGVLSRVDEEGRPEGG